MLPTVIGSRLHSKGFWLPSKLNPCDDPMRDSPLRLPACSSPGWYQGPCEVPPNFAELDAFVNRVYDFSDIPQLSALINLPDKTHCQATSDSGIGGTATAKCAPSGRSNMGPAAAAEHISGVTVPSLPLPGKRSRRSKRKSKRCFDHAPIAASFASKAFVPGPVLLSVPRDKFLLPLGVKRGSFVPTGPGVICLFSGSKRWAKAMLKKGAPFVLTFEVRESTEFWSQDLLSQPVRKLVEDLIAEGAVHAVGAGPVCASFSTAVTPPVRNSKFPAGVPWASENMRKKIKIGNSFCTWCAKLFRLCNQCNVICWIENPAPSWLWRQRCFTRLLNKEASWSFNGCVGSWLVDYCRFGTPWRKRTRFLHNFTSLNDRTLCFREHEHVVLRGVGPGKLMWTSIAEPYPYGLADTLADACSFSVGYSKPPMNYSVDKCAAHACRHCSKLREYDFACAVQK